MVIINSCTDQNLAGVNVNHLSELSFSVSNANERIISPSLNPNFIHILIFRPNIRTELVLPCDRERLSCIRERMTILNDREKTEVLK